jgi:hypothetical protein
MYWATELRTPEAHSASTKDEVRTQRDVSQANAQPTLTRLLEINRGRLGVAAPAPELAKNASAPVPASAPPEPGPPVPHPERAREIGQLRQALPDNTSVPGNRTPAELEQYMAEIREQQQLSSVVASARASEAERKRYYDLQAKHYEDEIELAEYCEAQVARATQGDPSHEYCAEVAARAAETKQANSATLVALQRELRLDSIQ